MTRVTQAAILAGGAGVRLRPLTDNLPKPMVPVNGRPFLEHLVELLRDNGITDIVVLLGYLAHKVTEHFGDGSRFGVRMRYSIGTAEDETGARVRNARDALDDVFLLMYCDNYWPLDLGKMTDFYRKAGRLGMMTVYNNKDGKGEYGYRNNVELSADGRVLAYGPSPSASAVQGVDIGFFVFDKKVVDLLPPCNCSVQNNLLPRLIARGQLTAYRTDEHYYAITTPVMVRAVEEVLALRQRMERPPGRPCAC